MWITRCSNKRSQFSTVRLLLSLTIIIASLIEEIGAGKIRKSNKFDGAETILAPGLNSLGKKVHKIIGSVEENQENVIFSPLSIHSALSMVSVGVKSGSSAAKSLINLLGYSNNSTSQEKFHNAYRNVMSHFKSVTEESEQIARHNGGIGQYDGDISSYSYRPPVLDFWTMGVIDQIKLKTKFRDTLKNKYNTSIEQVTNKDEAEELATSINKWGREAGFGGNVVQPDHLIVENPNNLILMSAVRIQGFWEKSFYERNDFFYNLGDWKKVAKGVALCKSVLRGKYAIFSKDSAHAHKHLEQADDKLDQLGFKMAQIPLIGQMTFTIIEPLRTDSLDELGELESALLADGPSSLLDKAFERLDLRDELFEYLQFPKFKFENSIDLLKVFDQMGLQLSLTEIAKMPMTISKAEHKAVIEVDINGLKAGAITRLELELKMASDLERAKLRMIVRNPFLFVIRYKSLNLFMGHVLKV